MNKSYALALISVLLVIVLLMSPLISSTIRNLSSTGKNASSSADFIATSGKATDVQKAVNAASDFGGGTVHIPAGTYDFFSIEQLWTSVNVPEGVNITGADPIVDADGRVTRWRTVLKLPSDMGSSTAHPYTWFNVNYRGDGHQAISSKPFRFSNIELIGWRYYNYESNAASVGIYIEDTWSFRVDHCHFQDLCWNAVSIGEDEGTVSEQYTLRSACGVIDHCIFNNTVGDPGFIDYNDRTLDYGITVRRWATMVWDPDIQNIWGHYTNYTVFVEDNYFSKWRHCAYSNDGFHIVFRYNIVDRDYGQGSVDGHGSLADDTHPLAVGTRCWEVYNNTFRNPDHTWANETAESWALNIRGGSWVVYDNVVINYSALLDFNSAIDSGNYPPYGPSYPNGQGNTKCRPNLCYIWGNIMIGYTRPGGIIHYNADSVQNINYFLRAPNQLQDNLTYRPYSYPFPSH